MDTRIFLYLKREFKLKISAFKVVSSCGKDCKNLLTKISTSVIH